MLTPSLATARIKKKMPMLKQSQPYKIYQVPSLKNADPNIHRGVAETAVQQFNPQQQQQSGGQPFFQGPGGGTPYQAQKDMAAFGAMGNLGIAGQNAMGQYGMNRDYQLTNQAIGAANAMGQQQNSMLNFWGGLGQNMAGMAAAAGQAGAETNKANALAGLGAGMVNSSMYGAQMMPYATGNMPNFNMGFGGSSGMGPGFTASGPEGTITSGGVRAYDDYVPPGSGGGRPLGSGGGRQFNPPPAPPYMHPGGGQQVDPYQPFGQASGFMGQLLGTSIDPDSPIAGAMNNTMGQFNAAREAVMDPSIVNSLNNQMKMGYGALGGLYGQSDYGFNTKPGQKRSFL